MSVFKRIKATVLAVSLLTGLSVAQANDMDPKDVLENSINTLIETFTANRAEYEQDVNKLYALAEEVTEDNWDFSKMSQLVLAKHWRKATDVQKADFTEAFKTNLIRTYATAMFQYSGKEAIEFGETVYKNDKKKRASVNAVGSLGEGAPTVPLKFSYYRDADDKWKIYNIAVEGISIVSANRSTYNTYIRANGLDDLIDSLNSKNGQ